MLVLHHMPRDGDNLRGATALEAAASTIIDMSGDGRLVTLRTDDEHRGRQEDAPDPAPLTLELTAAGPGLALAAPRAAAWLDEMSAAARTVLSVLASEADELSTSVLIELAGLSKGATWRALSELEKAGKVRRYGIGKSRYWRSETVPEPTGTIVPRDADVLTVPGSSQAETDEFSQVSGEPSQLSQIVLTQPSNRPTVPYPYRGGTVRNRTGKQSRGPTPQDPPVPVPAAPAMNGQPSAAAPVLPAGHRASMTSGSGRAVADWVIGTMLGVASVPELPGGLCRSGRLPALDGAWTSPVPALREAAAHACRSCPAMAACRDWALSDAWLDPADTGRRHRGRPDPGPAPGHAPCPERRRRHAVRSSAIRVTRLARL